jgi:thiol-disulfide isomerase/thioredoxin
MGRGFSTFRTKPLLSAVTFLALLGFLAAPWCGTAVPQTAFDLSGKPVDPLKLASGRVVVLVFVRTDCPVANRYAPTIQKLSAAYGDRARFWLVYPSEAESADAIRKHKREYGYTIPALRDPQRVLVKESQAIITPEVAVFDPSGKLMYHGRIDDLYVDIAKVRSAPTTHDLDDAIQAALSGKALPVETKPAVGSYISDVE